MKRFTIIAISIIFISINSTDLYSQHRKTKWLDGSWTGFGYQQGATVNKAWEINLNYNYATKKNRIDYSTFPCDGYWKLIKADKNKAVFIEYITNGTDKCQSNGTIIVTKVNENFIALSYFYPEFIKGVAAFSTLEKTK